MRLPRATPGYVGVVFAAFLLSLPLGWLALSGAIDGDAYDWMVRLHPSQHNATPVVVVAFDERSLAATGGMRSIRRTMAVVLDRLRPNPPAATAIDLILADAGDAHDDAALERALSGYPHSVLACELLDDGLWEDPIPQLRAQATALGHVHANPDPVSRRLPLEMIHNQQRRWALSLEAFRFFKNASIEESPGELRIGGTVVPAARSTGRDLYIDFTNLSVVSVDRVLHDDAVARSLAGKAVFIGVTALSAAKDRLMTPRGESVSGVEVHASAFETLATSSFRVDVAPGTVLLICFLLAIAAGLIFLLLSGWTAYVVAGLLIIGAHLLPHLLFVNGYVLPYTAPFVTAWITVGAAAAWQYFVVRTQLRKSEGDKARYQQAIQFVTHEMRSPLTAIQGSSELIGRYNLNDDKRKQVADMINSESKRLAQMIQTFLNIERLTDGQSGVRAELFDFTAAVETSVRRAEPLADRKNIQIQTGHVEPASMKGDRELMEYAVYNLLNNAVKYSSPDTRVIVEVRRDASSLRVSVQDEGMGMDAQELRNIFRKFYRTHKAEASGEAGTGIGLSLVDQIVTHHGGRMEVDSTPGKGSRFTMVLPRGIVTFSPSASIPSHREHKTS